MNTQALNRSILLCLVLMSLSSMGVTSCQNISSSNNSSFSNIYPTADAPGSGAPNPTGTPTAAPTTGAVTLGWTAPSGTVTGYYLYQCEVSASNLCTSTSNYTYVQNVLNAATTATVTGLTDGATYYYYLLAYNGSGSSTPSASVMVAIP